MTISLGQLPALLTASLPGIGGRLKQEPEDFEVEEIPAYAPSGTGEFLYLWVQKRDLGAEYFIRQIARRLELPVSEIGTAGLKDRHAVTRQMVSVPVRVESRLEALPGEGIEVLNVRRHGNKLRPGHLKGNRFRVLVREVDSDVADRVERIAAVIREHGLPNYYGPQRFGREGETLRLGIELIAAVDDRRGKQIRNPFLKKLAVSAVQSALFNAYLEERLRAGLLRTVLAGDVMAKLPAGGMFTAEETAREQIRFDAREIMHTGPIVGRKTFAAKLEAGEREAKLLSDAGFGTSSFHRFGKLMQGTRRHNLVYVDELHAQIEPLGVRFSFALPAGSYATVLLCEFMKNSPGALSSDDSAD